MNKLILFFLFYFNNNDPFITSNDKVSYISHTNYSVPRKFRVRILNNFKFSLFIFVEDKSVYYKKNV